MPYCVKMHVYAVTSIHIILSSPLTSFLPDVVIRVHHFNDSTTDTLSSEI